MLEGHFQLSSGKHSGVYVEKFRLLEHPIQTAGLCKMIADWAKKERLEPKVCAGPTTGGIILSYETARHLGLRSIIAEKREGGGRAFGRGFVMRRGERTLVIDDVLTTGGSVRDVLDAVRNAGGVPVGVGVILDRSGGRVDFAQTGAGSGGLPTFACLKLDLPTYEPNLCPLCEQGLPLTLT